MTHPADPMTGAADLDIDLGPARAAAARFVETGELPCIAFGVIDASGRSSARVVQGPDRSVDGQSIFFLGSVTKAIVATAVMQYVDEGRLDIDAPLARYLPGFEGERRERVTAAHVLTHTSGLPDLSVETLRSERPTYERSLEFALASTPRWEPGSAYEYNSAAWLLLSEMMARLSGQPFASALVQRLTVPLGMLDTSFDPRAQRERLVPVHGFRISNRLVQEVLLRFLVRAQLPGGGMFGTLADMLKLGRAMLPPDAAASGPRVLSGAAIDEMTRNHTDGMTHLSEDGVEREVRQGLGWRKPQADWPGSERTFTHGGISGGRLWVDPDAGFAFAFLSNAWQAPLRPAIAVLEEVYRTMG